MKMLNAVTSDENFIVWCYEGTELPITYNVTWFNNPILDSSWSPSFEKWNIR